nr:MFP1 attachment factor 1-like [Quercus suber]POE89361.1 mfp1 attachment factor 1 [Quercus suber]
MTDSESTIAPPTPEMESEYQDHEQQQQPNPTKKPTNNGNTTTTTTTTTTNNTNTLAFSIWPPTQRTRDAVVSRLVETLSKQSILSKRYGTLPSDEASSAARLIEEEAFSAAAASASAEDDGIEILQVYSREISRRMLDTVKTRASSAAASSVDDAGAAPQTPSLEAASATAASEDNSPTVTES